MGLLHADGSLPIADFGLICRESRLRGWHLLMI
jgi:hypothetical protein